MLAPDSRALLLDALRPPVGMKLDRGVATTFTLDLGTALTVPLALAGFSLSGPADVVAVMEALRTSAGRIDVFAQAGMIAAASWPGDLTALLEGSIHTVRGPRPGHLFHPKCWVLRFRSNGDEVAYRCIVTSRNLTNDRSWDVILRLDSDPEITRVNAGNDGLRRLFEALPAMSDSPLDDDRRAAMSTLADELRRVWWQQPDGVDQVSFIALGVRGGRRTSALGATFRGSRHLLISPFITPDGIETLMGDSVSTELSIVSRANELDRLDASTLADTEVFSLNPLANLADREDDGNTFTAPAFSDLHAKVYVIEANRRCRVYVGSPNATRAAFHGNVELLCELDGRVKELGVDTMLGGDAGFRSLLESYASPAVPVVDLEAEAGRQLDAILIDVAESGFSLAIRREDDDWVGMITSERPIPTLPGSLAARLVIAPYNRRAEQAELKPGDRARMVVSARPAADFTAFLVITASASIEGRRLERSCVVRAQLSGAPPDRLDDVLVRQLDTPEKFLRFLTLLLALGDGSAAGLNATSGAGATWDQRATQGLLELMVRALAVDPTAIDRIVTIVERLMDSPQGAQVLPAGWDGVWSAIRSARSLVGSPGGS